MVAVQGVLESKNQSMATLSLVDFPKFSESKEILKIGRSEVCVQGGVAECQTLKSRLPVYIYIMNRSNF